MTKINYSLRPLKQIERKIIIEALNILRSAKYNIGDYKYVGFFSPFYYDCILFHKYLGIKEMCSLERSSIEKRMKFNKPFEFVQIEMSDISDYDIEEDKAHLLWLDYEGELDINKFDDINRVIRSLKPGSIFIISVNAEYPLYNIIDKDMIKNLIANPNWETEFDAILTKLKFQKLSEHLRQNLNNNVGDVNIRDISPTDICKLLSKAIKTQIEKSIKSKGVEGINFLQLFNFEYKDGAKMFTIGGIIEEEQKFDDIRSVFNGFSFMNETDTPTKLSFPNITLKERLIINENLNKINAHSGADLKSFIQDIEIKDGDIRGYVKYYQYYPNYVEGII